MVKSRIVGAVAGFAALFLLPVAGFADSDNGAFSSGSLKGTYAYHNAADGVASFGVVQFDGAGKLKAQVFINADGKDGARTTVPATATGTYDVDATGVGSAAVEFDGIAMDAGVYDFVIMSADDGIAEKVYAVLRSGGIKGQLVNPTWTRISDAKPE